MIPRVRAAGEPAHDADLVGADPDTDVALIRIAPDNLAALPLAERERIPCLPPGRADVIVAVEAGLGPDVGRVCGQIEPVDETVSSTMPLLEGSPSCEFP